MAGSVDFQGLKSTPYSLQRVAERCISEDYAQVMWWQLDLGTLFISFFFFSFCFVWWWVSWGDLFYDFCTIEKSQVKCHLATYLLIDSTILYNCSLVPDRREEMVKPEKTWISNNCENLIWIKSISNLMVGIREISENWDYVSPKGN